MTDSSANPRTQGCIAGVPTGNTTGSTMQYVARDQFRVLPTPDEVIRYLYLNGTAAKEGYTRKPHHKAGVSADGPNTAS